MGIHTLIVLLQHGSSQGHVADFHFAPCPFSEEAKKTVEVLDTDYKSYAVILATRVKNGRTLHMMRLYSA